MKSSLVTSKGLLKDYLAYIVTIFSFSLAISLFVPVSALFLSLEVQASKFETGSFFTVQGICSIVIGMLIARYSDISGNRRQIILLGGLFGALTCLSFLFFRNYWLLLFVGSVVYSFSHIGGQVFVAAREYCIQSGKNVVSFTSIMRACFALAWVIGPPFALYIAEISGFKAVYSCCIVIYLITSCTALFFMPKAKFIRDPKEVKSVRLFEDKSVLYLCAATMLVFTCNYMYLITMPLYVTTDLGFSKQFAGIFMAVAAGLEIPVMLISGQVAKRFHIKYLLLLATFSGFVYYIAVSFVDTVSGFVLAQVANAIFIGIITSLGMLYFQELLPKVPGQATTLYTSSIAVGSVAAGSISGIIAEKFGYLSVFSCCIGLSLLSFLFTILVKKI